MMNKWFILFAFAIAPWILVGAGLNLNRSIWLSFLFYHFLFLLPASLFYRKLWIDHLKLPSGNLVLVVVAGGLIASLLAALLYKISGIYIVDSDNAFETLVSLQFSKDLLVPLSLYFVFVNASFEELFWRGTMQNLIEEKWPEREHLSVSLTAAAFGTWHYLPLRLLLNPGIAELVCLIIVVTGFGLGKIYQKTESLVIPMLIHALVLDLPIIIVLWLLCARQPIQ